jgi:hypothetical protein
MYTNFGKVIANKNIFNAQRHLLLRACLLRTNPVHFESPEDTVDNRIMSAYQTLRKHEVIRHWSQLLQSSYPKSRFSGWLASQGPKYTPVPKEDLRKLIGNQQVVVGALNLEALTNLMYLASQSDTRTEWFEQEATATLQRFDLRDATPSNLADILYYFGKTEAITDDHKQLLGKVLREAQRHLDEPLDTVVETNGSNTMAYQLAPNGRHSLLEFEVANFLDTKGENDLWIFFFYRFYLPLWFQAAKMSLWRTKPIFDVVEISPLTDHERLKAFFRAFT